MRGRRNQNSEAKFSLFPFLAVLLCTMGSLIVLLVIMVQRARVEAKTITPPPVAVAEDGKITPEERAQQEKELAEIEAAKAKLVATRAEVDQSIRNGQLDLGHLEENLLRLADRVKQLQADYQVLKQKSAAGGQSTEEQKGQLAELRQKIEQAKQELEDAKAGAAARPKSYSIVPYEGTNGTQRRPIYVECRSNQVIIQPEGIVLLKDDLTGASDAGNPLAAALRATREYWSTNAQLASGEPYPLLIVRPDGAAMYGLARRAMTSWSSEYGYELVDADMELEYPAADEALADIQRRTVSIARKRQLFASRNRVAANALRSGGGQPYLAASRTGGFEMVGGSSEGLSSTGSSRPPAGRNPDAAQRNPYVDGSPGLEGQYGSGGNSTRSQFASNPSMPNHASNQPSGGSGQNAGQPGDRLYNSNAATSATPSQNSPTTASGQGSQQFKPQSVANPYVQNPQQAPMFAPEDENATGEQGQPLRPGQYMPLSQQRGSNWATPEAANATIGYTRPISVECHNDRLVVLPDRTRGDLPRSTALRGPLSASIDQFVADISQHVQGWGMAGPQAYWKPQLNVKVYSGGEARFAELEAILSGSGIEVIKK